MSDKIFVNLNSGQIHEDQFVLGDEESHHLINVLRQIPGSEIWLLNGQGTAYSGRIIRQENGLVHGKITGTFINYGENPYTINLVLAVLKRNGMESAVEQATELGVSSIVPIVFDRCIARSVKTDRLNRIVITAAKQCGRSVFPPVAETSSLIDWIGKLELTKNEIVVCWSEAGQTITDWFRLQPSNGKLINIIVGTEGDFTRGEREVLKKSGAHFVSLGDRRLRSETAVSAALAILNETIAMHNRR